GSGRTSAGCTEVHRTKFGGKIQRKSAKSDNFVPGGPRDSWDKSTCGTRKGEMDERKKNRQVFCFTRFGTAKTKVRAGCESADFPQGGPFQAVQRFFFRTAKTKVREGREKVKKPQKRQGIPNRPMRENSSGTAGTKVRVGRKKPKWPKAKKKSQRLTRELQTAITFDSDLQFSQNWTFWN
ncbi:hypothetical protein KI387_018566, partial [Taxus chinensis]